MGENNSKSEKNIFKNDQLMDDEAACGGSRSQNKSNCNVLSNLIDNRLQEIRNKEQRITAKIIRCEIEAARIRLEKEEQNKIIRDKEKQPNEQPSVMKNQNGEEELSRQVTQVPKMPIKIKEGDGLTEETGTMKRRSDILKNRKNIEKQLIKNLANTEMAKLKIIYHKGTSLQGNTDENRNAEFCKDNTNSSHVPIVNGKISNNSTNRQNIYGQPPPAYSPRAVHVFDHLSIPNVLPDGYKHKNDVKMDNKRKRKEK